MATEPVFTDVNAPVGRVVFGPFRFDPQTGELWRADRSVHLRPQSQEVLSVLVCQAGRLVSREDLRTVVSGGASFGAFDQAVNDCIREIRAALGDEADSPAYVETLKRRGYRFRARVAPAASERPQGPRLSITTREARFRSPRRRRLCLAALAALLVGALAALAWGRVRVDVRWGEASRTPSIPFRSPLDLLSMAAGPAAPSFTA